MTRKTTNLHSYALTHRTDNNNSEQQEEIGEERKQSATVAEHHHHQINKSPTKLLHNETITISLPKDCAKENIPNNTTIVLQSNNISHDDGIHLFSSDTNEEYQVLSETTRIIKGSRTKQSGEDEQDENMNCVRNTDHDFYSKRSMANEVKRHEEYELQEQQSNYFADASEESQGSLNMVVDLLQTSNPTNIIKPLVPVNENTFPTSEIKTENITHCESLVLKEEIHDQEFIHDMPSTTVRSNQTQNVPSSASKARLSERDKYYRHKRRFNRRLEKRFDAILQVIGQVVKTKCPNVDVTPIVGTITSVASNIGKMLSSDSEDDNQSDDSNMNIP